MNNLLTELLRIIFDEILLKTKKEEEDLNTLKQRNKDLYRKYENCEECKGRKLSQITLWIKKGILREINKEPEPVRDTHYRKHKELKRKNEMTLYCKETENDFRKILPLILTCKRWKEILEEKYHYQELLERHKKLRMVIKETMKYVARKPMIRKWNNYYGEFEDITSQNWVNRLPLGCHSAFNSAYIRHIFGM
jgi:hypothetical protein